MRRGLAVPGAVVVVTAAAGLCWALASASGAERELTVAPGPGRAPCAEVEIAGRRVSGGCVVRARPAATSLTARTPFGDHPLARCRLGFELRVGGAGGLAVTDVFAADLEDPRSVRLGVSEACGDILACRRSLGPADYPTPEDILPWSGRLVASGSGLAAELDACFDTCLGRFEGLLSLDLAGGARRGWRLEGRRATPGESGLEVSGAWKLAGRGGEQLAIAVAGPGAGGG